MNCVYFFFNDTATTEIYTLSLHDALPICDAAEGVGGIFDSPLAIAKAHLPYPALLTPLRLQIGRAHV